MTITKPIIAAAMPNLMRRGISGSRTIVYKTKAKTHNMPAYIMNIPSLFKIKPPSVFTYITKEGQKSFSFINFIKLFYSVP
jgi:hypothetical protein